LEQRPHGNGAAERDAVICDLDNKTIDLRHQTERRKRPEIAYEEETKSGAWKQISPLCGVEQGRSSL
jgi:hypothetical protein